MTNTKLTRNYTGATILLKGDMTKNMKGIHLMSQIMTGFQDNFMSSPIIDEVKFADILGSANYMVLLACKNMFSNFNETSFPTNTPEDFTYSSAREIDIDGVVHTKLFVPHTLQVTNSYCPATSKNEIIATVMSVLTDVFGDTITKASYLSGNVSSDFANLHEVTVA